MPPGFPSDFPVYPRARLTAAASFSSTGQVAWGLEWQSLDATSKVQALYPKQFNAGDWALESTSNPEYARAAVDRTKGCGRYHGYLNASLDRVDGTWRLVLDEGQLFVPNSLFTPCRPGPAGCGQRSLSSRR